VLTSGLSLEVLPTPYLCHLCAASRHRCADHHMIVYGVSFGSGSTSNTGYTQVEPLLHKFNIRFTLPTVPTQQRHLLLILSNCPKSVWTIEQCGAEVPKRQRASKQLTKSHVSTCE
jgi:hypothetical protein